VWVPVTAVDEAELDPLVDVFELALVPLVFAPCCFKKLLLLEDEIDVDFVWEDAEEV
jgi:hypothetical protein